MPKHLDDALQAAGKAYWEQISGTSEDTETPTWEELIPIRRHAIMEPLSVPVAAALAAYEQAEFDDIVDVGIHKGDPALVDQAETLALLVAGYMTGAAMQMAKDVLTPPTKVDPQVDHEGNYLGEFIITTRSQTKIRVKVDVIDVGIDSREETDDQLGGSTADR